MEVIHLSEIASLISYEFQGLGELFVREGVIKFTLTMPVTHAGVDATPYLTEARISGLATTGDTVFFEGQSLSWAVRLATLSLSETDEEQKTLIATVVSDVSSQFGFISGAFNIDEQSLWQQAQLFRSRAAHFVEDLARETDDIVARWQRIAKNTEKKTAEMQAQQKLYGT